jgi:hypothetical protein
MGFLSDERSYSAAEEIGKNCIGIHLFLMHRRSIERKGILQ